MKIIEQNKNSSVIRILSFVSALVVLIASISLPSFAYTDTSLNGIPFSESILPKIASGASYAEQFSTGSVLYYSNGNPCSFVSYGSDSPQVGIALGVYDGYYGLIAMSDTYNANFSSVMYNGSYYVGSTGGNTTDYDSASNIYFRWLTLSGNTITNIQAPTFSTRPLACAAYRDYIDDPNPPPAPPSPAVAQFVLPAGNAVVIDLGAWDNSNPDKKIQLSQTTQYVHPQQWSTNQFYAYTDSIPSSISTPFTGQNSINWYGNGKTNLFNQTNSFVANFIYNSSLGRYLVIINPFVPEDHDTDNYNSPISVYVGQCSGYKFYQLKTDVSQTGAFGGQGDGTTGTGVYDPDTGTWTVTNDQTGDVWAPSQGGANSNNVVSTVSGWLEQISHQISDFFSGAIGAVTNLVSAGSDFIHSLSGLYAWLPGPVYSVLVSALILVITIGVIKVFI